MYSTREYYARLKQEQFNTYLCRKSRHTVLLMKNNRTSDSIVDGFRSRSGVANDNMFFETMDTQLLEVEKKTCQNTKYAEWLKKNSTRTGSSSSSSEKCPCCD